MCGSTQLLPFFEELGIRLPGPFPSEGRRCLPFLLPLLLSLHSYKMVVADESWDNGFDRHLPDTELGNLS